MGNRYMTRRHPGFVLFGSLLASTLIVSPPATAAVKSIQVGKTHVTVEVMNKGGPNGDAPKAFIWIENTNNPSNPPSAGDYEPAGIEVPLENGNGRGSAKISNVSVEVKKGRAARTGTNRPNGVSLTNGGAKVAAVLPQGTFAAGLNVMPPLNLAQSVTSDNGDTLMETWDAGTLYRVALDPNEARWVNLGASVHAGGDASVELVDVTPQSLTLRVLGDPTTLTSDDVVLTGLGMNVLPGVNSVGLSLGWQGTTSCYVNGEFWTAGSATEMESHEWTRLDVVPEPVHLVSAAAAGLLMLRRQQRAARP